MKPFAFRQRIGTLDWKTISSIDIEIIIEENQIEELQSIIDNIIFSEIKNNDIKNTSIIEIKKLINIMQLMLEYLLYCQESQLKLIRELHNKNKQLKKYNKELIEQNEIIKEDSRIYKRQIISLKSSIEKYKQMVLKQEGYVAVQPRIFNPLNPEEEKQKDGKNSLIEQLNPLVESMLRHERQTRDFVREIIDEQRSNMLRELERIYSKSESDRINITNFENQLNSYTDRITSRIERIAVAAANTALQTLQSQQPPIPQSQQPPLQSQPIISREEIERQIEEKYKLELKINEINKREKKVMEKELEIEEKLAELQLKIRAFEKRNESLQKSQIENSISITYPSVRSVGINTQKIESTPSSDEYYQKSIYFASKVLANKINSKHVELKFFFNRWKNITILELKKLKETNQVDIDKLKQDNNDLKQLELELQIKIKKLTDNNLKLENTLTENIQLIDDLRRKNQFYHNEELKKKKPSIYDKKNETDLMADALLRIQQSVGNLVSFIL